MVKTLTKNFQISNLQINNHICEKELKYKAFMKKLASYLSSLQKVKYKSKIIKRKMPTSNNQSSDRRKKWTQKWE